jgi:hypothetical protein
MQRQLGIPGQRSHIRSTKAFQPERVFSELKIVMHTSTKVIETETLISRIVHDQMRGHQGNCEMADRRNKDIKEQGRQ